MNILTDEEIGNLHVSKYIGSETHDAGIVRFARAIEKAVVEKLKGKANRMIDESTFGVISYARIRGLFEVKPE